MDLASPGAAVADEEPDESVLELEDLEELEALADLDELEHLEELEAERDEAEQRAKDAAADLEAAKERRSELRDELDAAAERAGALADERDEAKDKLAATEDRLDDATSEHESAVDRLAELESDIAAVKEHIAELRASMANRRGHVSDTVRELYKRGGPSEGTSSVFAADGSTEALRAAGYLRSVQHDQRSAFEDLGAKRRVLEREQDELADLEDQQRRVTASKKEARLAIGGAVDSQQEQVLDLEEDVEVAEDEEEGLQARVDEVDEEIEALEEAEDEARGEVAAAEEAIQEELARLADLQREHAEREEQDEQDEREERAVGDGARDGRLVACPVGEPHSFIDSYGAPRSGGRSHKGTDIMAPRGTPIYAYESGEITRMSTNRLGGITLNLRGDSGKRYYYAHLDGYVEDLAPGQRVRAGEQVGYNGDTGNARGTPPHLHIEVRPPEGSNVNPYPYMRGACG